jgi:L-iditol 2-dehydrogenase
MEAAIIAEHHEQYNRWVPGTCEARYTDHCFPEIVENSMKALLLTEPSELAVTDVPTPECLADSVLVRVAACGICGSDVHGYDGSSGRRIPPLVMGHEAAGTIAEIGSQVTSFQVGDRVTFDSTVSCGECVYCRRGEVNLCDRRQVLGVSCGDYRRHGAFAEYVAVPARILYRVPDKLSLDHAALIEAVSIAVHAVRRSKIKKGDTALVVGTGMIGLLVIQVLRHVGCKKIVAVDLDETRLTMARESGADQVIVSSADALAEVLAETNGTGVDQAFEVVGFTPTVQLAISAVRKGGAVTLVGNLAPEVALPLQLVVTRELTLYGTCGSSGEYPQCIELLASGAVKVAPLISAEAPLEEGPAWFTRLHNREPGLMKVLLKP